MSLAFVITTHSPGEHPTTTIVHSTDIATWVVAAHLRSHIQSDTPYADAVKDAEWAVETVMESTGAVVTLRRGVVLVSIVRSRLAEV